jgi:putative nucleotidyltransferase with HDIG domain
MRNGDEPAARRRRQQRAPRAQVNQLVPLLLGVGLILFMTLVLLWNWWPGQVRYTVGDTAATDVVATRHVEYRSLTGELLLNIDRGDVIVHRGDHVQPTDVARLRALHLYAGWPDWYEAFSALLFVACVTIPMLAYVREFQKDVWTKWPSLLLLVVIVGLTQVAARVTTVSQPHVSYVFPIATASMLIGAFLDIPLALLATALLSFMMGSLVEQSFEQTVVALVGGFVGTLAMWRLDRITVVLRAGLLVALATIAVAWSFALLRQDTDSVILGVLAAQGAVNGVLSAILTLGAFGLLGYLFGMTTSLQLMDLARPNQPLLQRLLLEAPGTYHHSILVSNLAERAALQIGADALLVRVGAFYHDVGKIPHPYYFIENQIDEPNIHTKLPPEMSAQMIAAHVTDGLRLAREHRLPRSIQDIIEQHHGTRLIGIFLSLAKAQQSDGKPIDESLFRYPGPRPNSKEAAIIMLADSIEAAARAANHLSIEDVEKIVDAIFRDRIAEGQFDECDLTMKDLSRARVAFLAVLRGLFHRRIDYPEPTPVLSDVD